ncbi:MAG: hypothetical protein NC402_02945 [Prevotella sp.]|nr:hypothetical protein [Prevotella sp.]MCM1074776.1 hypothetical protein [Ruminococcus sp.]
MTSCTPANFTCFADEGDVGQGDGAEDGQGGLRGFLEELAAGLQFLFL